MYTYVHVLTLLYMYIYNIHIHTYSTSSSAIMSVLREECSVDFSKIPSRDRLDLELQGREDERETRLPGVDLPLSQWASLKSGGTGVLL